MTRLKVNIVTSKKIMMMRKALIGCKPKSKMDFHNLLNDWKQ